METFKAIDIFARTSIEPELVLYFMQNVYHTCVNLGSGSTNLYEKTKTIKKLYRLNELNKKAQTSHMSLIDYCNRRKK